MRVEIQYAARKCQPPAHNWALVANARRALLSFAYSMQTRVDGYLHSEFSLTNGIKGNQKQHADKKTTPEWSKLVLLLQSVQEKPHANYKLMYDDDTTIYLLWIHFFFKKGRTRR